MLAPLPFVIMPHVYSNLRYKALEDFRAVSIIAYYPLVTVVHPSLPIHNLKELFAYARAKPGIAYASVGPGTSPHLISEYMAREEKLDMVHVPYRSGGQVMNDLITGRIVFYSGPSTEVLPQIRAGALRPIAVLTEKRTKSLPQVPTAVEQGFGKYVGELLVLGRGAGEDPAGDRRQGQRRHHGRPQRSELPRQAGRARRGIPQRVAGGGAGFPGQGK